MNECLCESVDSAPGDAALVAGSIASGPVCLRRTSTFSQAYVTAVFTKPFGYRLLLCNCYPAGGYRDCIQAHTKAQTAPPSCMPTRPKGLTTQAASERPLGRCGRRQKTAYRPNALRSHDWLASEPPRSHPTAKQLLIMRKTSCKYVHRTFWAPPAHASLERLLGPVQHPSGSWAPLAPALYSVHAHGQLATGRCD